MWLGSHCHWIGTHSWHRCTTWVTSLCQEPATGGGAFCIIFLNASSAVACAWSWYEQPPPLAVIMCSFLTCQVDQHCCTCIKWILSTWRDFFPPPKMSLLQVYFSLPIEQMLPSLRGLFCASQSLSLGGMPAAPPSAELLSDAGRWAGLQQPQGRGSKSCCSWQAGGGLLLENEKMQTSTEQMQTSSQLLWKQLGTEKEHWIWNQTDLGWNPRCATHSLHELSSLHLF